MPRKLRILQILEPSGGGSGRHFVDLCAGLVSRGHDVVAIHSPVRAEERFVRELGQTGAVVRSVAMRRAPGPSDIAAFRAIQKIVEDDGPFDIIHAHSSKAGALSRIRLPGRHTPRVYTPHAFRTMDPTLGTGGRLIYGAIEGFLGRFLSDAVIAVSDDEKRHAVDTLHIPARTVHTVINGVATPPGGARDAIREMLGIAPSAFLFGFVGRFSAQKAPERLIEAFRLLAGKRPDARLVMIGSGELEGEIRTRIQAHGLENRITLRADLPGAEAMQAFDALVMPSRYEAMSYVMLEAAASGLPMILTDVGGAGTVLENGGNGLLVANDDDFSNLSQAMLEVSNPQKLASFQSLALGRRDRYALETMIADTEKIYYSLLG